MKHFLRLIIGAALALVGTAAVRAQSLSPTGISASPVSAKPGDSVTFAITVNNGAGTQFGPARTANFTVVFSNLITGTSFTINNAAVAPTAGFIAAAAIDPTTGAVTSGTGTFTLTATLPTQTLEAGGYSAQVTLNSVTAGTVGTSVFTVSSSVITITGKPDLVITRLDYAPGTTYVGGQTIAMSLDYVNNSTTNGTTNVPYRPSVTGAPAFVRIQVVLSSNPTFGDADDFQLTFHDIGIYTNANGAANTISWTQLLPGNFSGSYYVLAKIDSLNALAQNDPPALNVNGNNVWVGNTLNPAATLINLLPSNFPTAYLASHATGVTTSASGYSDNPSISSDGRYVAFASDATNLVNGDTNAARDIFLFDSQTSLVRRLSVSQQGQAGNGASNNPAVSANGRYIAFGSDANNLVLGDTNGFSDIFVVDSITGLITRVSGANASGGQANNPSFRPALSQTGRYVVFESTATNLTAAATAVGVSHVYLHDRDVSNSGTFDTAGNTATRLIDVDATSPATLAGNAAAIQATISADGAWVAFASKATNLAASATVAGRQHVYVRPTANVGTATSGIKNVSVVTTTAAEGNADSQTPSLSSDGRYVAYASVATNLVAADTNAVSDIFVYDNNQPATTPIVRRVSVVHVTRAEAVDPSAAGFRLGSINPTLSADGRYVAFASLADNLTAGDTNGQSRTTDSNRALDIFVHDRDSAATGTFDTGATATAMVSVNPFGYQTNGLLGVPGTAASNIYPALSANGRYVAFPSDAESTAGLAFAATNLLPLDSNGLRDVFLFDRRTNATVTPATPPTVTITSPGTSTSILINTAVPITASATTTAGVVSTVQFFVNGASLGTSSTFPYAQPWTPTAVGTYVLSALVIDSFGNQGVSTNVSVRVNAAPSVGVTSPVAGSSIILGTTQAITATAAAATPGASIARVQFFANNSSLGTSATAPYTIDWTPLSAGTYSIRAVATDSSGITGSTTVQVTVVAPILPPAVALTSPSSDMIVALDTAVTLTADASARVGTIASVRFIANGVTIATKTTAPYTSIFTPTAAGTYAIVAQATDNNGNVTESAAFNIIVLGGIVSDKIYVGTFSGGAESGKFSFISVGGKNGVFIGHSTVGTLKTYFFPGLVLSGSGSFSSGTALSGQLNPTGAFGSIDGTRLAFIGPVTFGFGGKIALGYYTGNLANRNASTVAAIVGPDGSIMVYVADGAFSDAGAGAVDTAGNFNLSLAGGSRLVGRADPATGFLSATLTGGPGGLVMGALASGGSFSDGTLRSLSTRGQVGTGANFLIAGFVVGGSTQKQVMVRAIAPTLGTVFGLSGSLADSQLELFNSSGSRIIANDNWATSANASAIVSAAATVGAFPLTSSSLDSVILTTLAPGAYTAQVSGVGGRTGVALVELYDVDSVGPFSPQKVTSVSTRGVVGTGENNLIAGFQVSGSTSKLVLVRGIGPGLGALNVAGALADPLLQIIRMDRGTRTVVRENDNWETGNDAALVADASAKVGAFPLRSGSRDAVILISLSPGTYSATVAGVGGTTGVGLVEVYEVP